MAHDVAIAMTILVLSAAHVFAIAVTILTLTLPAANAIAIAAAILTLPGAHAHPGDTVASHHPHSVMASLSMCNSTAVVGSSSLLLRGDSVSAQIDAHDCVFRINHAPTVGYEQVVGSKTTYRVIGPAVLRMLQQQYHVLPGSREVGCDKCERLPNETLGMVWPMCMSEVCIFGHKQLTAIAQDATLLHTRRANRTVLSLSNGFTRTALRWLYEFEVPADKMSGGLFTLLIAAQLSEGQIDAYGFETGDGCCVRPTGKRMGASRPYKYYMGNRSSDRACCVPEREPLFEYLPMQYLQKAGVVQFHRSQINASEMWSVAGTGTKTTQKRAAGAREPKWLPKLEFVMVPLESRRWTHGLTADPPGWDGFIYNRSRRAVLALRVRRKATGRTSQRFRRPAGKRLVSAKSQNAGPQNAGPPIIRYAVKPLLALAVILCITYFVLTIVP